LFKIYWTDFGDSGGVFRELALAIKKGTEKKIFIIF
jgi:hypothetical protein